MTDSEPNQRPAPADPSGIDEPHDVLAAEEFSIPSPESGVPGDPTGLREPHDVLAAEEFAMPAGGDASEGDGGGLSARTLAPLALAAVLGLILALILRRRS